MKMNRLNNILTILLCSLTLISCGQTEMKHKADKIGENKEVENKYTKVMSDSTNKLTNKVENLEIEYTVWGCACPNWIQTKDNIDNDTTKNFLKFHFYIEPANKTLELPIYFDASKHKLKVSGQFYEREDYPQGTIEIEGPMPKAKVFRYTKVEVIDKSDRLSNPLPVIGND
jgi:hypothetical protein